MGEDIRLKSKAGEIGAYLAAPKGTPKGGVVVIQEIFGVNHHIKAVTDKFAADGYLALAPRFFDHIKTGIELGYTPDTIAEGRKYVTELGLDKPVQDVEAAIEELKKRGAKKVAVTGYCWGGTIAWLAATRLKPDAVSAYYGGGIHGAEEREGHGADPDAFRRQGHAHPDDARERAAQAPSRGAGLRLSGRPRLPLRRARQLRRGGLQAGDGPDIGALRQARWLRSLPKSP